MKQKLLKRAALLLCALAAMLLFGCGINITTGLDGFLTGEEYPDAEKYQTGTFTYSTDGLTAVEVYWRTGAVEIVETEGAELRVSESGELPESSAVHSFLDGGVLRIRFCASGAEICVKPTEKHLRLEVPKGINLSIHTTAATVTADTLEQKNVLISAHSGKTSLGTVTADSVDLSSSSGDICADNISAQTLKCSVSSGTVALNAVSVGALDCATSSGTVDIDGIHAETVEIGTSSGNIKAALAEVPDAELCTSSGNVTVALGESGAAVLYTTSSGKLRTDRTYERKGDLYVFGDGESKLTVETSSGNFEIQ